MHSRRPAGPRRATRSCPQRPRGTWSTADCPTPSARRRREARRHDGGRTVPRVAAVRASAGRGSCSSDPRTPVNQTVTDRLCDAR